MKQAPLFTDTFLQACRMAVGGPAGILESIALLECEDPVTRESRFYPSHQVVDRAVLADEPGCSGVDAVGHSGLGGLLHQHENGRSHLAQSGDELDGVAEGDPRIDNHEVCPHLFKFVENTLSGQIGSDVGLVATSFQRMFYNVG